MTCTSYESPTDFQGDDDNILFAIDTSVYGVDTIQDFFVHVGHETTYATIARKS